MSSPQLNQVPFRRVDGDATFLPGQNSNADPAQLPGGQYSRSMNTVNRGGIVQCRPGHRCKFVTPPGNFQGGTFFYPKRGTPVIVFGVEGLLYIAEFPFRTYRQISGVSFLPSARQIFFKQVEQSVQNNPDGSLTFISPRNLLIIQDGGFTPAAVFDGTDAEHQRGAGKIPLGGPMEWVGDRLWVARNNNVYASDIANPLGFTETQYIASIEAFILPGEVTALSRTTSVDNPQLLVFTSSTTDLIQAAVRDRSQWLSTPNFQRTLFSSIGCLSQRSVHAHYGLLWWWSAYGLTSFDSAVLSVQSSSLPYRDAEMQDSKSRLSEDLGGVAAVSIENYFLVSVPYCDQYNRHTWVMDTSAYPTFKDMAPPAWNGFWTGTRPIQWLAGLVNDTNMIFHFSKDFDGQNRLWESFTPDRLDDYCPITWYLETRGYFVQDALGKKQFRFADVFLGELLGDIDIAVFWAGTSRGPYKRILTKRIRATEGTLRATDVLTAESILFALKKQSRRVRTQDAREIWAQETEHASCGVEDEAAEFIEQSIQLLIVVSGPGAVRGISIYTDPEEGQRLGGACEENESVENAVRFDGAAATDPNFLATIDQLSGGNLVFRSNQTVTLTSHGIIETGVGEAESTISQGAADKIARRIAERKAAKRIEEQAPEVISLNL